MFEGTGSALMAMLRDFVAAEGGATAIEYALIAGLVSVAIIVGVTSLGGKVGAIYEDLPLRLPD
jgi:pilus assembly protein Flp/PilA